MNSRNRLVLLAIFLTAMWTISFASFAQASNYFVQFRILTLPDADAAQEIDKKIGAKSGVLESSADYVTSTYFCLLSSDTEYTEEDFISWFAKLGFEIVCFSKGIQHIDPMVSPHILKSCEEQKTE